MNTKRGVLVVLLACCAAAEPASGADAVCHAASGGRTLPLIELYTSEGCSSCPPADRWIAGSFAPGPDTTASVLAFHVDYWDRLGWADRFARSSWSKRQEAIARSARSATVYTPQVLLQGADLDWRDAAAKREIATASDAAPRAWIRLEARPAPGAVKVVATAGVSSSADRAGARLLLAYVDGGHRTDVPRGENAGVTLAHEHVVRALQTSGAPDAAGRLSAEATFDIPADAGTHPQLVAFVERDAARAVLQSAALALDRCR